LARKLVLNGDDEWRISVDEFENALYVLHIKAKKPK
jgi:hypothetical protein